MPQVGVNQEPLRERLIFGFDGANYRVIKCDTNGQILVAIGAGQSIQANEYNWLNAAWRKAPLKIGYSGYISVEKLNLEASAASTDLNGDAVPVGEIWELQSITAWDVNRRLTAIRLGIVVNSILHVLALAQPDANYYYSLWNGKIIMQAGDYVSGNFLGTVLHDDIYLHYYAVRVDIDQ